MRTIQTLFTFLLFTTAARAQDPVRLSLQESTDFALKNTYSVRNAQLDVLIAKAQIKETLSITYPHVNGAANLTHFPTGYEQLSYIDYGAFTGGASSIAGVPFTIPYTSSAAVNVSQVIFDGSVVVAWKAREAVMELAKQGQQVTEENVRYNVLKAYNNVIVTYRQYDIVRSSLSISRLLAHDLEVTYRNGLAEKIDVDRSSVQVNNQAADSMRVANALTISEQVLKYQMGMDINTPIVLTDTSLQARAQGALALITEEENYLRVPEYNLLNAQLKTNEYNVLRYKNSGLPSLSGFGGFGYNNGSNKFADVGNIERYYRPYINMGLSLNVPIFNGSMRRWQLKEAQLNAKKTKNNIDNMKLTIDFQAATSRTNLRNSLIRIETQRRNMELSQSVLALAQKKYKAGVGSNLEVSTAQGDVLQAQNNYFLSLLEVANADADLRKALGLLK
jgi:outer membrane protein